MELACVSDLQLEELLIQLRKSILLNLDKIKNEPQIENFLFSLSCQCYINEYIYKITKKEDDAVTEIEKDVFENVKLERNIPSLHFLILSCYRQLYDYKWLHKIKVSKN